MRSALKPIPLLHLAAQRSAALLGALALLAGVPASAGSFQVNPVNITLPSNKAAGSVSIQNSGKSPVSIRVLTYRWTQANGQDVYSETRDLISSPPIFTIKPGGTQLVRVGLRTPRAAAAYAYRVILEEIPSPAQQAGIQVALRINMPLYVLPKDAGEPDLKWSLHRGSDGALVVEAANSGTRHSQVLGIDGVDASGRRIALTKDMGVVLPGSSRQWQLGARPDIKAGSLSRLFIRTQSGEQQTDVRFEGR